MKNLILALALTVAALHLIACQNKRTEEEQTPPVERTVLMGDPMRIIEGAQLNPVVNLDYFRDADSVEMFASVNFVHRKKVNLAGGMNQQKLEERNKPKGEVAPQERTYTFKVYNQIDASGEGKVELTNPDGRLTFLNYFVDGKLVSAVVDSESAGAQKLEVLHYSESADHKSISVLMHMNNDRAQQGDVLVALYFNKNNKVLIPPRLDITEKFNYLYGPNRIVKWTDDQPINLEVCNQNQEGLGYRVTEAVDKWNIALGGRQKINVSLAKKYYPFSDLNQHCLYYVNSYLIEPDPRLGMFGLTYGVRNMSKAEILDLDIFIFNDEFNKGGDIGYETRDRWLRQTLLHEMGHFLGLDHQFDKSIPSIMGYNFSLGPNLTDYDLAAIQTLYKKEQKSLLGYFQN